MYIYIYMYIIHVYLFEALRHGSSLTAQDWLVGQPGRPRWLGLCANATASRGGRDRDVSEISLGLGERERERENGDEW